eukprot:scaffold13629_cov101-Isochrysis_galbana.AAC.2
MRPAHHSPFVSQDDQVGHAAGVGVGARRLLPERGLVQAENCALPPVCSLLVARAQEPPAKDEQLVNQQLELSHAAAGGLGIVEEAEDGEPSTCHGASHVSAAAFSAGGGGGGTGAPDPPEPAEARGVKSLFTVRGSAWMPGRPMMSGGSA